MTARFTDAGHRIYLVGGLVRDLLMGRELSADFDIDLTTDARPDQIKALLATSVDSLWTQGERFGTIGARIGDRVVEVTTHRAEAYVSDSRKPEVRFSTDIVEDLSRRDFTVNAMAVSLPDPELIDPFGGSADLAAGRLRTPISPLESFNDDPLRMLRAARFIAGHGFLPEPELVDAVRQLADRLEIVSVERIRDELDKLLVVEDPSTGLGFLVDTNLAAEFIPEILSLRSVQDPAHRHEDVLAHSIAVVVGAGRGRIVRLAALFHDVGKPASRSVRENDVSFQDHEVIGERIARGRMQTLKYPRAETEAVSKLVALHHRVHTDDTGWTDSAVRRLVRDAGDLLDELIELARCNCAARKPDQAAALKTQIDDLESRIGELSAKGELHSIHPDLDGEAVMELLGVGPGRVIGAALDHLLEIRLEEGPLSTEEATNRLLAWWADQT